MKKPTCTFSYGGQCARRFFHSYLKETKKINNQFLNDGVSNSVVFNDVNVTFGNIENSAYSIFVHSTIPLN